MRILLIMDPLIRVPPQHYGGIERVVADLASGLTDRGHEVTLWAAPGSRTDARIVPFGREGEWTKWSNLRNTMAVTARFWRTRGQFDLVHNFGRLAYLFGALRWKAPKVQTYMRTVNPRNMRLVKRLGGRNVHYTAVSRAMRDTGQPGGGQWSVIYNCAPVDQLTFRGDTDPDTAPLAWLGRFERCKGAHTAIQVARQLGRRLLLAGTISGLAEEKKYFHEEIEPEIDGDLIRYLGPVDNQQKDYLLGGAAALLSPIEWEEPFPLIIPEALLCGTPVIAFRRGGVPEGIDHGQTGFLCDNAQEMAQLIGELGQIDRNHCRMEGLRRYSNAAIVNQYEQLYQRLISADAGEDAVAAVPRPKTAGRAVPVPPAQQRVEDTDAVVTSV